MISTENEQQEHLQNAQQSYSAELRNWVNQAQSLLTNCCSQTVNIVKDNSVSIHLLSLFIVFFIVQTIHVYNVNKLKTDLKAFLVESEVLTNTDRDVDLLAQFMEHFGKDIALLDKVKVTLRWKQS